MAAAKPTGAPLEAVAADAVGRLARAAVTAPRSSAYGAGHGGHGLGLPSSSCTHGGHGGVIITGPVPVAVAVAVAAAGFATGMPAPANMACDTLMPESMAFCNCACAYMLVSRPPPACAIPNAGLESWSVSEKCGEVE